LLAIVIVDFDERHIVNIFVVVPAIQSHKVGDITAADDAFIRS